MSVQSQEHAMMRFKGKADEFQKHASRLAEVARQSAAISADARREWLLVITLSKTPRDPLTLAEVSRLINKKISAFSYGCDADSLFSLLNGAELS